MSTLKQYKINSKTIHTAIGYDLNSLLIEFLHGRYGKIFVLSNDTVFPLWNGIYKIIKNKFKSAVKIVVPDGENQKNLSTINRILKIMIENGADRTSVLITIGGGVITDMGGFAASILLRGISVVHYPTTLLAQADAAIGGKTGVDFDGIKNMVGSFYQPDALFCDTKTLTTLPKEHVINGMGEILKYALLGDKTIRSLLEKQDISTITEQDILYLLVKNSVDAKFNVVCADERENSKRAVLNFGHTLGHAIESASSFSLLHGQSVAIGASFALYYSKLKGYIGADAEEVGNKLIARYGLAVSAPKDINFEDVIRFMMNDKKRRRDRLRFVFLKDGLPFIEAVDDEIKEAVKMFMKRKTWK